MDNRLAAQRSALLSISCCFLTFYKTHAASGAASGSPLSSITSIENDEIEAGEHTQAEPSMVPSSTSIEVSSRTRVIYSPLSNLATFQEHLASAASGVTSLRRELRALKSRNAELQRQLDLLFESPSASIQPKRGKRGTSASVPALAARVKQLTAQVVHLEKVSTYIQGLRPIQIENCVLKSREKDRKKIKKVSTPPSHGCVLTEL